MLALLCAPLLAGSACEKKKLADTGAISAMDRAEPKGPVDETPLPNVDVSKLAGDRLKLYYKLLGSLKSPCGKAHSLRVSFTQDTACKRAPYAVKYVVSLLEDEQSEEQTREFYANKYEKAATPVKFDVSKAPRIGPEDAPIRLVEFFDYACPHCAMFAPILAKVADNQKGKVVEYFMMFPLEGKHPDSRSAAQAALAANQQGKFHEMHELLFAKSPQHNKAAVSQYAAELGLDAAKFAAAYDAAGAQVSSDLQQGNAAGVDSTPTLFFNDRKYEGPMSPEYIEMWIEEELAVNR
ncbi:MAG: thioredoxin domain-containing protein [Kofleriaceae bacterium]|nr:thioredoxin domain-containing protein [Kofleriaceae bacterium]